MWLYKKVQGNGRTWKKSSVVDTIENWVNPLSGQPDIVSLSTSTAVSVEIASDLLRANEVCRKAYQKFKEERLETDLPKTKFVTNFH